MQKSATLRSRQNKDEGLSTKIVFLNDLPPVPCDGKLLPLPFDEAGLSAYRGTSLEHDFKFSAAEMRGNGILNDLADPAIFGADISGDIFGVRDSDDKNGPFDFSLEELFTVDGLERVKNKRLQAEERKQVLENTKKRERAVRSTQEEVTASQPEPQHAQSAMELLDAIEKTFDDAKTEPVNAANPNLAAKIVLPLVPSLLLCRNTYVHASFDVDPMYGKDAYMSNAEIEDMYKKSVLHGTQIEDDSVISYYVPKDVKEVCAIFENAGEEAEEDEDDEDLFADMMDDEPEMKKAKTQEAVFACTRHYRDANVLDNWDTGATLALMIGPDDAEFVKFNCAVEFERIKDKTLANDLIRNNKDITVRKIPIDDDTSAEMDEKFAEIINDS